MTAARGNASMSHRRQGLHWSLAASAARADHRPWLGGQASPHPQEATLVGFWDVLQEQEEGRKAWTSALLGGVLFKCT